MTANQPPTPPKSCPPKPPLPGWLWPIVFLNPFLLLMVYGMKQEPADPLYHKAYLITTVCLAIIPSVGLTSGLAMACRFYGGWAARLFGTIVFGLLMTIATAAVVFAGCVCTNNIYIR